MRYYGGCSSVGRASDCGSEGRGFEPHHSPHYKEYMLYFLWAFLFGALGVSIMVTSFQSSYRPILKFSSGVLALFIGVWCVSKIDMPTKYNYGKKIVKYVRNKTSSSVTKIKEYVSRYT